MSKKKEEKKYPEPIVGALVVNKDGKVLLAKSPKWSGKYTIPGGHVELGESLENAIRREVREETGLEVDEITQLNFSEGIFPKEFNKKKHFIYHHFICEYTGNIHSVKMNEEFNEEFIWIDPKEAATLDLLDGVGDLIKNYILFVESKNYLDSWRRCQADFENYKKSQAAHQEEFRKYAKIDMTLQILPVVDNFYISLEHVPEKEKKADWVAGIYHIQKQMLDILKNNGVEEIEVKVGDKFDPEIHEAIGGDGKKQVIKKIIQKGYRLNGRIMRAARVEVG